MHGNFSRRQKNAREYTNILIISELSTPLSMYVCAYICVYVRICVSCMCLRFYTGGINTNMNRQLSVYTHGRLCNYVANEQKT